MGYYHIITSEPGSDQWEFMCLKVSTTIQWEDPQIRYGSNTPGLLWTLWESQSYPRSHEKWVEGVIFSQGSSLYEPRFFCEGLASGDLIFRCIVGTSFFYVSYRVMCVCLMFSHFPDHVVVNMSTLHGLRNMCRVGGYHFMFRRELIFRGVADTARRPDGRADRWDKA